MALLLDFIEIAKSHTGVNLAEAFGDVLKEFGIEEKVSTDTMRSGQFRVMWNKTHRSVI